MHGCESTHLRTVPVTEMFQDRIAWQGEVEVFRLGNNPKVKECYAWGFPNEERGGQLDIKVVLKLPPVDSPETAVRIMIASEAKIQNSGGRFSH
jgi:hypothetical protein